MTSGVTPDWVACPQEFYRSIRTNESLPLVDGEPALLGRREVDKALRTPAVFSSNMAALHLGSGRPLPPLQVDPPAHSRYRRLIDPLFSPKRMAAIEPEVRALTADLVMGLADRGGCDFSVEFAQLLPPLVLCRMFGFDRDQVPDIMSLKDDIVRPHGITSAERRRAREAAGQRCYALFDRALAERRRAPTADMLTDLLSAEVDGARLSTQELLDICYLLLIAGTDSTTNALECSFAFLAASSRHRQQLVDNPEIIPAAVEELLRWESPTVGVPRYVTSDVVVNGCQLKRGTRVMLMVGAANVDDEDVPDSLTVNFHRRRNNHIAFGAGPHRCLGLHLARLQMRIAFREWHLRIPTYRVAPETGVPYRLSSMLRDIEHLPLVWP